MGTDSQFREALGSVPVFLVLAFGSGATALVYEVVWFQLLELVIGSSAISLGILLATFMGGTGLGSVVFPRVVSQNRNPLRVYAAIELGIGAAALLTLVLLPMVSRAYVAWGGGGLQGFILRGVLAGACLLLPTLLMGATLPALSRYANRNSSPGLIYGSNIFGAVTGSLLSGFYFLRQYDAATAIVIAACGNALVAGVALLESLRSRHVPPEIERPIETRSRTDSIIYLAIALSGFCALAAEAVWTRTLALLLGGSVYTFSIILAVFLAGLGVGSAIGSLLLPNIANPRRAMGWCQILTSGAIAWTAYNLSSSLPYWPINPSISQSIWFNFQLDLDLTLWALLPATVLWGASFSFALAAIRGERRDHGRPMANVYAANTAGAILGAVTTSLFLISWSGSQRLQQYLVAISAATALMLLFSEMRRARWLAALLVTGFAAVSLRIVPPLSGLLIAHGRYAATWVGKSDILYAEEGLNSDVAVSSFSSGALTFHVAGKIQASSVPRDMRLQRMLGHLTSLTAANPRSTLVIGCGAGITAGAVVIDPRVERLTLVEIEPLVPQAAATFFGRQNFGVVSNPRVQLHIDDGRHFLLTTKEKFDAITADPLDPWVRGAANLYTREFFEAARAHLNPGGVVTMYIQLFATNAAAVKSAIATFFEVFPNGTIWGNTYEGRGHDMILLGSVEPLRLDLAEFEQRLNHPEYATIAQSLSEIEMTSSLDLFATYAGRAADLKEWLREAEINRDRNLRMQYLAGIAMDIDDSAAIYSDMLRHRRFPEGLFSGPPDLIGALRVKVVGE